MIPVRSERQVEGVEVGVLELGDEHRRHAVEASCSAPRRPPRASPRGSKAGAGMTMQAPWVTQPRLPITMPKQW